MHLKTCLRAELKELVNLAEAIQQGNGEQSYHSLGNCFVNLEPSVKHMQAMLVEAYLKRFFEVKKDVKPELLLKSFDQFRVLSPLRKGPFGVNTLNDLIHQELLKQQSGIFIAPIILIKNDYELELFNGEVGILCQQKGSADMKEGGYAFFKGKGDASFRKVPVALLPAFEYAYCLSIHKSQGSEFDEAICVLPPGSEKFGRQVLYTAVTRVRKKLEVWSNKDVFLRIIAVQSLRGSGIRVKYSIANH
jgi:exodeoxyribonuclease V alpha subunit